MRLNYYRFPEGINVQKRFLNEADFIRGMCKIHINKPKENCRNYIANDEGWGCKGCENFSILEAGDTVYGTTIKNVKSLLKKFGGSGWTEHPDRSGCVYESTEIKLRGNNSQHRYNRYL